MLETSGRNTIPGKDFSSNHNIYSPRNKHLTPPPRSSIPRQGWHGVSPFNLTILLPLLATRHQDLWSTIKGDTHNRVLLLAVSTQTRLLGIGRLRFPHSIPHNSRDTFLRVREGGEGLLTVIRKSNFLFPSSLFSSRGKNSRQFGHRSSEGNRAEQA